MTPFDLQHVVYVGLGNPGAKYEFTRHNMGFLVVQAYAKKMGWHFKEDKRCNAFIAKGLVEGTVVHLVKPATYMNLSGHAIRRYLDFYKLDNASVVAVVDDIALPFGQLRLKLKGSAGGHNGLKSIEAHLGTSDYKRLRMGIGRTGDQVLADYVLDPFSREELEELEPFVNCGVDVLQRLLKESASHVMNAINKRVERINKPPEQGLGENKHESTSK